MKPTDAQLIEALKAGDAAAIDTLVARYEPAVYRFGLQMCRNPDDAQEVLQDTLLAATKGVRDFRGDSSLTSWLYAIARSFCIKRKRRAKSAPEAFVPIDETDTPSSDPSPDEAVAGKELRAALEDAIGSLEPVYREVLVLRDVEGLSAPEVASVLGMGVDAVKSRLHRARVALREKLVPTLSLPQARSFDGCPNVVEMLSRHLEGDIGADDCARMQEHVATCTHCTAACDSLRTTLALCERERSTKVPNHVQEQVRAAIRAALASS